MIRTLLILCLALNGAAGAASRCGAQQECPEQLLSELALKAVRSGGSAWADEALRATRFGQLEDSLYDVLCPDPLALPTRVPQVAFFRVDIPGYTITDDRVTSARVQLPDPKHWLVAIDIKSESVYLLEGSRDPLGGFNRLMRKVGANVRDSRVAEQAFYLYLHTVRTEKYQDALPLSALELESLVMRHFAGRTDPSVARQFERWWGGVPASVKMQVRPPTPVTGKDGFVVRYFWYQNGELSECAATVGFDGTIRESPPRRVQSGK